MFFVGRFAYKPLEKESNLTNREKSLNLIISSLLSFGIVLALRYLFGYLGYFFLFFSMFGSGASNSLGQIEFLFFAVMASTFFPLFKIFFKKFIRSHDLETPDESASISKKFFKRSIIIIVGSWVVAVIFLSIDFLEIPIGDLIPPDPLSPTYDVFLLGFEWAFFIVIIDISLTIVINSVLPVEKRLSKEILNKSMVSGGIISFLVWSAQLVVFELYLKRAISRVIFETKELIILKLISFVILFVIGIFIIGSYAKRKKWDDSYIFALLISLGWLLINLYIGIGLYFFIGDYLLVNILIVVINIFIGSIMVKFLYNQKFAKSLMISIIFNIILFFLAYIPINLAVNKSIPEQDIRVLTSVVTVIYIISFIALLKRKFAPEASERIMKEIQLASELEKPKQISYGDEEKALVMDIKDLTTYFYTEEGVVRAVEGISFKIYKGEILGLVGETGCGKSVTALSLLKLIRHPGKIEKGEVDFGGFNLLEKSETEILPYRGKDITMIFQDPLNSLNPVFKVGNQISEVFLLHKRKELLVNALKSKERSIYSIAREWSEQLLKDLNIPAPELVFDRYPHELSGGMRQRIQIAMALVCRPKLLIADEPTTALDVTVQNQILKLMKELKEKYDTSILFITHDLGIISKMCDRVAVMYSGHVIEYGKITTLFTKPFHPYTRGLISSVPVVGKKRKRLEIIPGMVPNLIYPPSGCRFHPRCEYCFEPCSSIVPKPIEVESNYFVSCHLYDPEYNVQKEVSI
ncbi:MAG: ABC transporter ATP-binding protein [Promethearchaeota archaeon]